MFVKVYFPTINKAITLHSLIIKFLILIGCKALEEPYRLLLKNSNIPFGVSVFGKDKTNFILFTIEGYSNPFIFKRETKFFIKRNKSIFNLSTDVKVELDILADDIACTDCDTDYCIAINTLCNILDKTKKGDTISEDRRHINKRISLLSKKYLNYLRSLYEEK